MERRIIFKIENLFTVDYNYLTKKRKSITHILNTLHRYINISYWLSRT
jgi:hypothetical protein